VRYLTKLLLSFCALTLTAHAAVVEGVILDEESGNPLARTQVSLTPLPGTLADVTAVRTGARGSFVIISVLPGWYVLRTTRRGYAPTEYGQLHPGRPGRAFQIADDRASGFLEIHMSRLPAITGTVLDENSIGMPRRTVHIYSANKPIRHIGQTDTDDRGNYRIGELDPGSYLLRSAEGHLEDETPVLATYSKSAVELGDAVPVTVRYGETAHDVTIRPIKGRLLTLSGMFLPPSSDTAWATLTMITDTGRREIAAGNRDRPFSIPGVQPGTVEFLVKGNDGFGNECGSYALVTTDKDVTTLRLACNPLRKSSISISGAIVKSPIVIRRVDLDGATEPHPIGPDESLAPGHWEISVPRGDYYVQSVRSSGSPAAHVGAWWGFDTGSDARIGIQLSSRAASISGVVSTGGSPIAGAPIFVTQEGSGESWNGRSDPQGNYLMGGLAPGAYTIMSGFDLDLVGPRSSKIDTVSTSEGNTTVHALELILP
jgi:hypothetical protein